MKGMLRITQNHLKNQNKIKTIVIENTKLQRFDINIKAENGLKRGITTGSCATAAVKAALLLLEFNKFSVVVEIILPDEKHFLTIDIHDLKKEADGSVTACVKKIAGDDPDHTDGAIITANVRKNKHNEKICLLAGKGVGVVTSPGLQLAIGEPAINPVPRKMIMQTVEEITEETNWSGYDITIGCVNGEEIAKRTFNPRIGIKGGISILGTTGIVEPMSLSAYKAAIEVYIKVAVANSKQDVIFLPGNIGLNFAQGTIGATKKQIVHISNFVGFSLEAIKKILLEENIMLENLWILGHPAKLAKILDLFWDTHSKNSFMAMEALARVASELNFKEHIILAIKNSNTVQNIVDILAYTDFSKEFWVEIEDRIQSLIKTKVTNIKHINVGLFDMNGNALGKYL